MVLMVAASLFDHIFGSFPPETRSDRTLILQSVRGEGPGKGHSISSPSYAFLQRYVSSLTQAEKVSISKVGSSTETTFRKGEKIKFELKYTDGVFWEILEFDFLEGRPYTTKEVEEAQRVAVINEATRRAFFGEQAVGKYIELKGQPFRVVGVVPNVPMFRMLPFADIWVPISAQETDAYLRYDSVFGGYQAMILARSAAEIPLIKEEFADVLTRVEYPNPDQVNRLTGGPGDLRSRGRVQPVPGAAGLPHTAGRGPALRMNWVWEINLAPKGKHCETIADDLCADPSECIGAGFCTGRAPV